MAQTKKAQATAARIATAAGELFLDQGYDHTTIGQVAHQAGVAAGTVLLHFDTKSELATAAFTQQIGATVQRSRQRGSSAGDPIGDVVGLVEPLYRWYGAHQPASSQLLRQALFSDGPWGQRYNEMVQETAALFTSIVAEHQALSRLATYLDPVATGQSLLAIYLLILLQGLRGLLETPDDQLEVFTALARNLLRVE